MFDIYPAGSQWRRWDLHFHTPSSYDYHDKSVSDEEIIETLIKNNISLVVITDHHFMDVKRIKHLQELGAGKISVLPGIELRSELGGSDAVHFIGIFPEDADLESIWISLQGSSNLNPAKIKQHGDDRVYCDFKETSELIRSLGGVVSIHAGSKSNSVETIKGKAQPHKMALKTDLAIGLVDIYELGDEGDQEVYVEKVFPSINKRLPMVLCSDNHNIREYRCKNFCWVKADPNFYGLKHAIHEAEERFYIGFQPPKSNEIDRNKGKYLAGIKVCKCSDSVPEPWFSVDMPLNSDLIAIIGNKGSGKSALGDIIGLVGNSKNGKHFSFLNAERFKKLPQNPAQNFSATLVWKDGRETSKLLSEGVNDTDVELIQYLPQRFIETVCNDLGDGFQEEINRIVFSYLPEENKLQKNSFDTLIEALCAVITQNMRSEAEKLTIVNKQIIELEKKSVIDYRTEIINKRQFNQKEIEAQIQNKPQEVVSSSAQSTDKDAIASINKQISDIEKSIQLQQGTLNDTTKKLNVAEMVSGKIRAFQTQFETFMSEIQEELEREALGIDVAMQFVCDVIPLDSKILELNTEKERILKFLDKESQADNALHFQKQTLEAQKLEISKRMSGEEQQHQKYLDDLANWKKRNEELANQTKEFDEALEYLNTGLNEDTCQAKMRRTQILKTMYALKCQKADVYRQIYSPVVEHINNHGSQVNHTDMLNFTVKIRQNRDFTDDFLGYINQSAASEFRGVKEGRQKLSDMLQKYDFNNETDILQFTEEAYGKITENLSKVESVTKKRLEFYNFLFGLEYLEVSYGLNMGNISLEQLSPGEKGTLLLIFYLFLDKSNVPLVIDQPEDNLDNYSVYQWLMPYIREAKKRRQVIIVTHNPNLAVACDAEQIIQADMNKQKLLISYRSGSIENPSMNKCIVDVLEGTMPAFTMRKMKCFE